MSPVHQTHVLMEERVELCPTRLHARVQRASLAITVNQVNAQFFFGFI